MSSNSDRTLSERQPTSKELAPCPFCGSAAVIPDYANEHVGFYVACTATDCYACVGEGYDGSAMPDHVFRSPEEAAAAWNRRSAPETADSRILPCDVTVGHTTIKAGCSVSAVLKSIKVHAEARTAFSSPAAKAAAVPERDKCPGCGLFAPAPGYPCGCCGRVGTAANGTV